MKSDIDKHVEAEMILNLKCSEAAAQKKARLSDQKEAGTQSVRQPKAQ